MDIVCAKCGAVGGPKYKNLLVYCNTCSASAQHRYCMDPKPIFDAVRQWCCEECCPIPVKSDTGNNKLGFDQPARIASYDIRPFNRVAAAHRECKTFKKATQSSGEKDSNMKSLHEVISHSKDGEPSFSHDANGGTPASQKMDVSPSSCIEGQQLKRRRKLILPEEYQSDEDNEFIQTDGGNCETSQNTGDIQRKTPYQLHVLPICTEDEQLRRGRLVLPEESYLDEQIEFKQRDDSFHRTSRGKESAVSSSSSRNVATGPLLNRNALGETMDEDSLQDAEACVKKARRRRLIIVDEHESDEDQDQKACTDNNCQASKSLSASVEGDEDATLPLRSQTYAHGTDAGRLEPTPVKVPKNPPIECRLEHTDGEFYIPVLPIVDPIWSGRFQIYNEQYGPFAGHLSTRACKKVWNISRTLPPALQIVRLSRLDSWPKSFEISPPTDDNIALFFFPSDSRNERLLDQFIEDITIHDHALKASFDDAELLVFASNILPEEFQRFQGKYYLWGVFKARHVQANKATRDECNKEASENAEDLADVVDCGISLEKHGKENLSKAEEKKDEASQDSSSSGVCVAGGTKEEERNQSVELFNRSSEERDSGLAHVDENDQEEQGSENLGLIPGVALECEPKDDDGAGDECLNLFPVMTENIRILSRVPMHDEVDLELGLGLHANAAAGCGDCEFLDDLPKEKNFSQIFL